MERLIEQIVGETKLAQMRAGNISDYELAEKLQMSAPAFAISKSKGFGKLKLLYDVADALGCEVEVRFVGRDLV